MFSFIPNILYTPIFFHTVLFIMLIIVVQLLTTDLQNMTAIRAMSVFGYLVLIWVLLYMGTRPNSQVFGDMFMYSHSFEMKKAGFHGSGRENEIVFGWLETLSTLYLSKSQYFFLISFIYILPCYIFSKVFFKDYWFYAFFMFIASFSFWPYGTNGLRNGMATSLFVLALCFYRVKPLMFAIMALALGTHNSTIIPIAAFAFAFFYRNTKMIFIGWLLLIPLSLVSGGFWEGLFSGLMGDDVRSSYLGSANIDQTVSRGFRIDFILYSMFAVVAGYIYIIKKGFNEKFYVHLYNTFLVANGFWILVIRANYSNRFAYLSWFLMAPVMIYPLVKMKMFPRQNVILAGVLTIYYAFTYFMFILL